SDCCLLFRQKQLHHINLSPPRCLSTKATGGRDEWNDAWETTWQPEDLSAKNQAPLETDVNFSISDTPPKEEEVLDPDTKAFVEDMADNWEQRRKKSGTSKSKREQEEESLMDGKTTSKGEEDGNIWEMYRKEEDILVQEYERRIAFSKFQVFFPFELLLNVELGPDAKRGSKGSALRFPSLADPASQPFTEDY
nr:mucin-related protein [Tanacetum cinerariifolium]